VNDLERRPLMSVERKDTTVLGLALTQEWKTNISVLGLALEQRSAFAAIPAQYLL